MSPVAIGLDLLLVILLLTALTVGLRLNGRLKALKAGQADFVRAVGELDVAAARAESGLKVLRAASEDVHDELLTRIETARALIARLDTASDKASRALQAAPVVATTGTRPASTAAALASPTSTAPAAAGAAPPREPRPALRFPPIAPRPSARGVDDDLFEADPAPRRLGRRP